MMEDNDRAAEPIGVGLAKASPLRRGLAGLACPVLLALAALLFPLGGYLEQPWRLVPPFVCLYAAFHCGVLAARGRGPQFFPH